MLVIRWKRVALLLCLYFGSGHAETPAPAGCTSQEIQNWKFLAFQAVRQKIRYPQEAIAQELEGTAVFEVVVDASGALKDSQMSQSSGFTVLDAAAFAAIKSAKYSAAKCSGMPSEIAQELKVVFRLR